MLKEVITILLLSSSLESFAAGVANPLVPTGTCQQTGDCVCNITAQGISSPSFSYPLCLGGKLTVPVDDSRGSRTMGFWANTNSRQHRIELYITRYTGNVLVSEIRTKIPIVVKGSLNSPQEIELGEILRPQNSIGYFVIVNTGGAKECTSLTPRKCIICVSAQNIPCQFVTAQPPA